MDFKKLNEELSKFWEESPEFETVLIQAMKRINNNEESNEDLQILNDFNKVVLNNKKLSSSIYMEILHHNSGTVNNLINSLKGTKTYADLFEGDISSEQFYKELEDVFKEDFSNRDEVFLRICTLDTGRKYGFIYVILKITKNKLELIEQASSKDTLLYVGKSVQDCIKVIEDKLLNSRHRVFEVNEHFAYVLEGKQKRITFDQPVEQILLTPEDKKYYHNKV